MLGSLVMALVFYGTRNSASLTTGWNNVVIKAFQVGFWRSHVLLRTTIHKIMWNRHHGGSDFWGRGGLGGGDYFKESAFFQRSYQRGRWLQ